MKPIKLTHLFWQHFRCALVALAMITVTATASAQAPKLVIDGTGTPHQVVESVTEQLVVFFSSNKNRLNEDPEGYYADVRQLLEPVIAFPYIARNVMARYWGYATAEQRKMFVDVFTDNLVETYVKGMASYSKFDMSVVQPEKEITGTDKANVVQLVIDSTGETKVVYNMRRKDAESNWQLVNLWLGSSNLGKSLQSQFDGAVTSNLPKLSKGDKYNKDQVNSAIDAAIQNWGKA
ncbi:MAG: ABC transporter substrate-binding protein [Cellvibrionaceae bacterium]|nr:ABC transporter substrate-binding protein [Cellvibrionaceae bacterium]